MGRARETQRHHRKRKAQSERVSGKNTEAQKRENTWEKEKGKGYVFNITIHFCIVWPLRMNTLKLHLKITIMQLPDS